MALPVDVVQAIQDNDIQALKIYCENDKLRYKAVLEWFTEEKAQQYFECFEKVRSPMSFGLERDIYNDPTVRKAGDLYQKIMPSCIKAPHGEKKLTGAMILNQQLDGLSPEELAQAHRVKRKLDLFLAVIDRNWDLFKQRKETENKQEFKDRLVQGLANEVPWGIDHFEQFLDELLSTTHTFCPEDPLLQAEQVRYRESMDRISEEIAKKIQEGAPLRDLQVILSLRRHKLAQELGHAPSKSFTTSRMGDFHTYHTVVVGKNMQRYHDQLVATQKDKSYDKSLLGNLNRLSGNWDEKVMGTTIRININGQTIPLTTLLIAHEHIPRYEFEEKFGRNPAEYPAACFIHTPMASLLPLRSRTEALFEEIRNLPADKLLDKAAELHYLLAHAMFLMRGSASTAESLIEGLFKSKGLEIKWSARPDLEALCEPDMQKFVQRYREISTVTKKGVLPSAL